MKPVFYVKSFEEDFTTKRLVGEEKVPFQTIENVMRTKKLKPNTKSFGQPARLSTTILHKNYLKTYRPQGIIFQTDDAPEYVLPFDLVLLSKAKEIVVHYYRIKDTLHLYYRHELLDGFERFIFKNIEVLLKKFPSPQKAWLALNVFRKQHNLPTLPKSKFRLVEYNETVFTHPIRIKPIAIFGYRTKAREFAKKYGLLYARSAKEFFEKHQKGVR